MNRSQMRRPACDHKQYTADRAAEVIAMRQAADLRPRTEINWRGEKCRRCGFYRIVTVRGEDLISPEVRALVLARDGHRCVCCGRSVLGQHYSLGHRVRASQGGRPVASNLVVLLGLGGERCHGRIDLYRDPADAAKGYRLQSGQDPRLISVMVFSPGGSGATVWLDDLGNYLYEAPKEGCAA
jgi:hypothetical protein